MTDCNGECNVSQHHAEEIAASRARSKRRGMVEPPASRPAVESIAHDREQQALNDEAFARYRSDQKLYAVAEKKRKELAPVERWDARWIKKVVHVTVNAYDMVVSFVGAHACGPVSDDTYTARAPYCRWCTYRRRRESPNLDSQPVEPGTPLSWRDMCAGYAPEAKCDCPADPFWRPSKIPWLLRLRAFGCAIGNFEKGSYAPPPPRGVSLKVLDGEPRPSRALAWFACVTIPPAAVGLAGCGVYFGLRILASLLRWVGF